MQSSLTPKLVVTVIKTAAALCSNPCWRWPFFTNWNQNLAWEMSPVEQYFYSTFWLPPLNRGLFPAFTSFSSGEQASYCLTPESTFQIGGSLLLGEGLCYILFRLIPPTSNLPCCCNILFWILGNKGTTLVSNVLFPGRLRWTQGHARLWPCMWSWQKLLVKDAKLARGEQKPSGRLEKNLPGGKLVLGG